MNGDLLATLSTNQSELEFSTKVNTHHTQGRKMFLRTQHARIFYCLHLGTMKTLQAKKLSKHRNKIKSILELESLGRGLSFLLSEFDLVKQT